MSVLELQDPREEVAKTISEAWLGMNVDRDTWLKRGMEARRYVTATNTDHTEVGGLPWKNKTTIPKLTQVADNLKSYYMAALMPTDDWFVFEASTPDGLPKARLIEKYMGNKIATSGFRKALEQIVWDWILYGNCFAGVTYVKEYTIDPITGNQIPNYIGPKLYRVSPYDCVMDHKAPTFDKTPFIRKRIVSIADVIEEYGDSAGIDKVKKLRGSESPDWIEWYKKEGLQIDGFNDFTSYLNSQYIELLEYWGDIFIRSTGEIQKNRKIIVADRSFELANTINPAWDGKKPFAHSGWRILPDNLYGQGPLDNLVGMQYRCDHLENLKADAFDQIVHPVTKIIGNTVEDFDFGPGCKIYIGDPEDDVVFDRPDSAVLQCNNEVALYHQYIELMSGSPKESMGFRTPGEKTAFEMNVLQQGADRMFIDKLLHFEEHVVERILNLFYEQLIRNFDISDVARVFNDDVNALEIREVTKEDVVASGNMRPLGSKHFAARNKRVQELQNFIVLSQNPIIAPHFSGLHAAEMFEEELGFDKYNIVEENIGVKEQMMTQLAAQQYQQQLGQMGMEVSTGEEVSDEN